MTIPIYIAASSHPSERDRVTAAFTAARMLGLEPFDWRVSHRPTAEMTREERCEAARVDLDEIVHAKLVWVLAPSVRSDSLVEMGIALGYAAACGDSGVATMPIIVSGPLAARGIFAALADSEHDSDAEAIDAIRAWVEGRA